MGEKVEGVKNEGEKKAADAGKKVDDGSNTVVYKTDMHCEGCAKKIKQAVKNFPGVEQVKTDAGANKLTVTGKMDPAALKAKLEEKIKKKVDLVSPQPAKKEGGGGGGDKKADEKSEKPSEKKAEEKKPADNKPKQKEAAAPKESTVPLKIRLHCEGCIQKMRSKILKYKGVSTVSFDMAKDLVTVVGTMDTKALVPYLSEKFKRPVDVIALAKDDGAGAKKDEKKPAAEGGEKKDGGGDKKEEKKEGKKEAAPGGEKKEEKKDAAGGGGGGAVVNKMEYSGYPYAASTSYWYDPGHVYNHNKFVMEAQEHQAHVNQGYGHYAMPMEHYPAPQMFSDENPNGCSVM
ncbi:hypothetical protein ACLB2K_063822 [Fragaria x ananassa]